MNFLSSNKIMKRKHFGWLANYFFVFGKRRRVNIGYLCRCFAKNKNNSKWNTTTNIFNHLCACISIFFAIAICFVGPYFSFRFRRNVNNSNKVSTCLTFHTIQYRMTFIRSLSDFCTHRRKISWESNEKNVKSPSKTISNQIESNVMGTWT